MSERAEPATSELADGIQNAAKEVADNSEEIGEEATTSVDRIARQVAFLPLLWL